MSLNESIKKLEDMSKGLGSLDKLLQNVKTQAVENSGFSESDKKKMSGVLNSINFEELADKNATPEQIKELIKSKL